MAANDPKDLIIPISKFKANLTLPATPALPTNYTVDFGSFEKGSMKISGDLKEVWKAYNGALGLDVLRRVKGKITYEFEQMHLSPAMLVYLMGSASGAAPMPGKIVDIFGIAWFEAEGEPIVPTGNSNEGDAIFKHHSFAAGLQMDGDLTAHGDDFAMIKATINVYLGRAPGAWAAAARPITPAGA